MNGPFTRDVSKLDSVAQAVVKMNEAKKKAPEPDVDVKVGDNVHMGLANRGGAGYRGKVHKIEGDTVHFTAHPPHGQFGPRTFSGHRSKVSKD